MSYTLTFFGSDPRGVRSAKRFANLSEATEYATSHLALMVSKGKSFRTVHVIKQVNGATAELVKVVRA